MLEVVITKRNVQRHRAEFALDVAFEAEPGITVLFGSSGCGKTTTLLAVAGIVQPDSGRITANGAVFFDSERAIDLPVRSRAVGYVFQDLALFPHLTVEQNVEYGLFSLSRPERRKKARAMLEILGIAELSRSMPAEISGGQQQRVALARALAIEPRVLLLDEPLSGLDPATKQNLIADLRRINRERRIPALYVTHDRAEALALGEKVVVLDHGKIIASGSPLDVLEAPRAMQVARLGGVENVLSTVVRETFPENGAMQVSAGDCLLSVPLGHCAIGETVRVGIRAGDVLLAIEEPRGVSARNVLPAVVTAIERAGDDVLVSVNCGCHLVASLTPQAIDELRIEAGSKVWLLIKTHSCHLLA